MRKKSDTMVKTALEGVELFSAYSNKRREHFLLATLDSTVRVINIHVISIGLADMAIVGMREVFYPAILDNAVAVIAAHNHPSGSPAPSLNDDKVTATLVAAGRLLGIRVLDHIIVARDGFYSYHKEGRMEDFSWESGSAAEISVLKTPPSFTS
jgi:DNA repair protein RadC